MIEEPEVKELPPEFSDEIKQKIVKDKDAKMYFEFYRKLRKKIGKYSNKKGGIAIEYLLLLPDFVILLIRLMVDKRVSLKIKLFIGGILAYVVMPIDFIPDFIPVAGYLDDLIVVVYGLNIVLNETGEQILKDNWNGKQNVLSEIKKVINIADKILSRKVLNRIKKFVGRR